MNRTPRTGVHSGGGPEKGDAAAQGWAGTAEGMRSLPFGPPESDLGGLWPPPGESRFWIPNVSRVILSFKGVLSTWAGGLSGSHRPVLEGSLWQGPVALAEATRGGHLS